MERGNSNLFRKRCANLALNKAPINSEEFPAKYTQKSRKKSCKALTAARSMKKSGKTILTQSIFEKYTHKSVQDSKRHPKFRGKLKRHPDIQIGSKRYPKKRHIPVQQHIGKCEKCIHQYKSQCRIQVDYEI